MAYLPALQIGLRSDLTALPVGVGSPTVASPTFPTVKNSHPGHDNSQCLERQACDKPQAHADELDETLFTAVLHNDDVLRLHFT